MKKLTIAQEKWTVKSYESYLAPLSSFIFKNMIVFGYKTETKFCHKTGLIISNKISHLIVKKQLQKGLSKNLHLFPLEHQDFVDFMEIFVLKNEFLSYDNVQKDIMKQIFYNFPYWKDLPSHIKTNLKGKYWNYYYYLSINFKKNNLQSSDLDEINPDFLELSNKVEQLKFAIAQREEANDMWPEKQELEILASQLKVMNVLI